MHSGVSCTYHINICLLHPSLLQLPRESSTASALLVINPDSDSIVPFYSSHIALQRIGEIRVRSLPQHDRSPMHGGDDDNFEQL